MGNVFEDLKIARQTQRAARSTQAGAMINEIRSTVDKLTVDASGTWNIQKGRVSLQFYPTKGTWQVRGRMMEGGIFSFINWLEKQ